MYLIWPSTAVRQAQPEAASMVDEVAEGGASPLSSLIIRQQVTLPTTTNAALHMVAKAAAEVILSLTRTVASTEATRRDSLTRAPTCPTQSLATAALPICRPQ